MDIYIQVSNMMRVCNWGSWLKNQHPMHLAGYVPEYLVAVVLFIKPCISRSHLPIRMWGDFLHFLTVAALIY